MKKMNLTKLLLMDFILVFAAMSFGPCITVVSYPIISSHLYEPTKDYESFAPAFCCAVSIIEMLLLKLKNNKVRLVGLIFNQIKTFLTYPLIAFLKSIYENMGGLFWYENSLNGFGYATIAVGCIITVLYIVEFITNIIEQKQSSLADERKIKNEQ